MHTYKTLHTHLAVELYGFDTCACTHKYIRAHACIDDYAYMYAKIHT